MFPKPVVLWRFWKKQSSAISAMQKERCAFSQDHNVAMSGYMGVLEALAIPTPHLPGRVALISGFSIIFGTTLMLCNNFCALKTFPKVFFLSKWHQFAHWAFSNLADSHNIFPSLSSCLTAFALWNFYPFKLFKDKSIQVEATNTLCISSLIWVAPSCGGQAEHIDLLW